MERIINGVAPIRICDIGGWSDTWFAGRGRVVNLGVYPYVEVQAVARPLVHGEPRVVLHAEDYGERYAVAPGAPMPDRHPLLEAAIDTVGVPESLTVEITIHSDVPPGCSTGTSAAVTVALVGVLSHLSGAGLSAQGVASMAHDIEWRRLGIQTGIQDQLCSAFGGVSDIVITEFPAATVSPIPLSETVWWELERRLVLLFLGRSHESSAVHEQVIRRLAGEGGTSRSLGTLRHLAAEAREALAAGDLTRFGEVMTRNTQAQAELHGELVSADAWRAIAIAREHGAIGWKVNGAGGDGGSLTFLCGPDAPARRRMVRALVQADPLFQVIPTYLSRRGLRVWEGSGSITAPPAVRLDAQPAGASSQKRRV